MRHSIHPLTYWERERGKYSGVQTRYRETGRNKPATAAWYSSTPSPLPKTSIYSYCLFHSDIAPSNFSGKSPLAIFAWFRPPRRKWFCVWSLYSCYMIIYAANFEVSFVWGSLLRWLKALSSSGQSRAECQGQWNILRFLFAFRLTFLLQGYTLMLHAFYMQYINYKYVNNKVGRNYSVSFNFKVINK